MSNVCGRHDHTLWKPDPTEISNRLGWLTVTDAMSDEIAGFKNLRAGCQERRLPPVVLLGMGGSSLGAEVLGKVFGALAGYPALIVLDSTLPEAVRAVESSIDIRNTLFLISSKSGTTIEPLCLYEYFREPCRSNQGDQSAGHNFAAITDRERRSRRLARDGKFPSDLS